MLQQLTEEQIQERQELFFTILDNFINENYEVAEDYVMTEEDAYITSILLDYFEENYKFPTLKESALESITGYDINTPLYEEMAMILMDESIGTFIAGARHGIQDYLATKRQERTSAKRDVANVAKKDTAQASKDKEKQLRTDTRSGAFGSGIKGDLKKSFAQGGVERAKAKAAKAKAVFDKAHDKNWNALNKKATIQTNRANLASKIDTGVANVKNKVKSAISTGAQKVGRFLGRAFG